MTVGSSRSLSSVTEGCQFSFLKLIPRQNDLVFLFNLTTLSANKNIKVAYHGHLFFILFCSYCKALSISRPKLNLLWGSKFVKDIFSWLKFIVS